ncbi:metal ABC transporter ATP-binding protein [Leptolyngbya sp. AN02str]|uniref:metal ABC transporter ATP-binding protein n=1 Tax=Leptolyngbya sp. AN02str TaxID=3423363 RepID=UPI003D322EB6
MLKVQHLSVNYRGVEALEDICLAVGAGELVGLIGPNGAGKSTLIKALLGLVRPQAGRILFEEKPLVQQRRRVAYVPQRSQIDWDYPVTAWNVVMMAHTAQTGWFRSYTARSRHMVKEAMERVGIWHLRDRQIGELSGGQQQRVFLARAIAQQADLFLFDEPFNAVDKKTEGVILDLFAELKAQAKTVLVCSHEWGQALHRYDRLLLLNQRLLADGDPQAVMTLDNIQRAYGENLSTHSHRTEVPFFC